MKENSSLYVLLYNYLLAKIHYGFYPKGGYLPSIIELSSLFGVSTMVVRTAFQRLRENGYLSSDSFERSVVLYDLENPKQEFPQKLLIQRDDFDDFHRSFDLIFPSIYFSGLSMCDSRDLEKLRLIMDRSVDAWDSPLVDFLAHVAKRLQNSLIADIYYDVTLFSYPTYLDYLAKDQSRWEHHQKVLHKRLLDILVLKENGNTAALRSIMKKAYPLIDFCPIQSKQERNSPYQWGKPQICLSAASKIVSRIYNGEYKVHTFLPSARILSEELSVAVITMRRSIVLLNDLGVVESVNGKGTKVLSAEEGLHKVKWDNPAIRKNSILYLESLHMLAITCRQIADSLFPFVSSEDKMLLLDKIRSLKGKPHTVQAGTLCLKTFIYTSNLLSLRNVYDKLFSLLVWGQPLSYLKMDLEPDQYTGLLISGLESNDPDLFGSALEQAYSAAFLSSQEKLTEIGMEEAKRLVLPAR